MAGQSVGLVTQEQSTAEIIQELIQQAEHAIQKRIVKQGEYGCDTYKTEKTGTATRANKT